MCSQTSSLIDPYNDKVIRSTQGALFHLHLHTCSLPKAMHTLKEHAIPVYATALHQNSIPLAKLPAQNAYALIFGNEGQGVSEELLAMSDATVFIEMERFESLNVAVAAGIDRLSATVAVLSCSATSRRCCLHRRPFQ